MKQAKCLNCGANIEVDETKDAGICMYCNTPYVTDKLLSVNNTTTNNSANIINNYYGSREEVVKVVHEQIPPKPTISISTTLWLMLLGFYPGIIYLIVKGSQISKWNQKYNK